MTQEDEIDLKSKVKSMNSRDYYCRLKEMQRRLDKARNDIKGNVSRSVSRSKSPHDIAMDTEHA